MSSLQPEVPLLLLVAEKPSVATQHYKAMLERCAGESFVQHEGYLQGKEHCITWCVGHLVTLAPFDKYPGFEGPWQLSNLPMLPRQFMLEPIERTKKQLHIVQQLMGRADVLVNGADAGREGNLIFDLILDYTPELKGKTVKRLWVNSYVGKELDAAWKQLEDAQHRVNLSYAARLRQRADWMVGLNATRAYTLTAGRGKLISVGRVQTPTLNLIVQRDALVENFKEHFFYGVQGQWKSYTAQWIRDDKVAFFDEPAEPQKVVDACTGEMAELLGCDIKKKSQFPPKPFDLTELQKEANKRFKINVQQVLDLAQVLYEKKLLTYPRTDSAYLPESMRADSYRLAQNLSSPAQKALLRPVEDSFVFINSEKVTDHYAIIPTGERATGLPELEQKIYDLVAERFVNAWLMPYAWSEFTATLRCKDELFRLKLRHTEQQGYKDVVKDEKKKGKKKGEGEAEGNDDDLAAEVAEFPSWQAGEQEPFSTLELLKKKKSKPKYFTEATLLAAMKTAGKQIDDEELAEAMKDRGLGTPATQAGIIETLKKRGFVEAQKNNLVSTPRGRQVIGLMDEKIKSPEMTGEWEYKLSLVEKGEFSPAAFRDGIVDYVQQLFSGLREHYGNQFAREQESEPLPCPKCRAPLAMAPWGYVCEAMGCDFRIGHTVAGRSLSHLEMRELLSTGKTEMLQGFLSKKGTRFNASLSLDPQYAIQFSFPEAEAPVPYEGVCPLCKAPLLDFGNHLACSRHKEEACAFVLYKSVAGRLLQEAELQDLLKKGKTEVLQGFVSKKGEAFAAALCLKPDGKTAFEFARDGHFHGKDSAFVCPLCKKRLQENQNALFCPHAPCAFTLFRTQAGKKLRAEDIKALLDGKQTAQLSGFTSKAGAKFDAALRLDSAGKAVFVFARQRFACPLCGMPMEKGEEALSCTRAQCGYALPRLLNGRVLGEAEWTDLLEKKRTGVLEGFSKNGKQFKAALELRADGRLGFDLSSVQLKDSP